MIRRNPKHLDLQNDRVVFRRIGGRIVPVRVGVRERALSALKGSVAPALVAGVLTEGIAHAAKVKAGFSMRGALSHFATGGALKSIGKAAALTVAFSVGYNLLFGKRQRQVVEVDRQPQPQGKARIWLASKPALTGAGHNAGEHSYLHVRDSTGKSTVYGGQIKNLAAYGKSGVKLVKNFPTDRIASARNVHDLTGAHADRTIARIHKEAAALRTQLKAQDYQYRMIPVAAKTYNSNSVVNTLLRRSNVKFKFNPKQHNLPGFARAIPKEGK